MRQPRTIAEIGAALLDIDSRLRRFDGTLNVELNGRRIINAGDGIADSDYVTMRQLRKLLSEPGNPALSRPSPITNFLNRVVVEGGETGDDVWVNGRDVLDPNFNDGVPDAPAGNTNVKWQQAVRGTETLVSGYVPTTKLPVTPLNFGNGAIVGGPIIGSVAGLSTPSPFVQGSAGGARTDQVPWPLSGWVGSMCAALRDAETGAMFSRFGFGYVDSSLNQFLYDTVVRPDATAGAYGSGSQYLYIPEGVDFRAIHAGSGGSGIPSATYSAWSMEYNAAAGEIPYAWFVPATTGSSTLYRALSSLGTQTENAARTPLPACTIKRMYYRMLDAQPAGGDLVITVYKNGSPTSLSVTMPAGAPATNTLRDLTNEVTFAAGDQISIETANASGSTSCQGNLSFIIEPSGFTALLIGYPQNSGGDSTKNYDMPFYNGTGTVNHTEGNMFFPCPRAFRIATGALRLWLDTAPTSGAWDWVVRKNGSDESPTINLTSSSTPGVITSTGAALDFAKLDRFTLSHVRTGGAGKVGGWSIALTDV